ncbi:MAG: RAMP superfamily CRISPR-associated protein [Bacteroidia bacterium]|nr:RAMP superfamily CRISPR-associated protein [Bacteroidia bacterium]
MNYTLTLTTESYLLTGSGEGGVLIDADVVFHATGFPMIPARRIKGMLKESLEEVMEIAGEIEEAIGKTVISFFGEPGKPTYEGKLLFHNLMLPDWQKILMEISENKGFSGFQPDFIKAYFTAEIQQTAIGRENKKNEIEGVAKKRSLRNYRVIKPGFTFEGLLETTSPLSAEEEKLLKRAVMNLRHAGTRRNRGFGKVKCMLNVATPTALTNQAIPGGQAGKLSVTITTQSPVILAEQQGDQNTVFTRKYISGNQIRGLLANAFIRKKGLSPQNAHQDSDFFEVFLSGKVQFGNLNFKQAKPIPLYLHGDKLDKDKPIISVFAKPEGITKSVNKIGVIAGNTIHTNGFTPKTTFNFHNSRPNRSAGRSTENDAETGIFYYESLNEGQAFEGEIAGDVSAVTKLTSVLSSQFRARMGRSRSAQYGSVQVTLVDGGKSDSSTTLNTGDYVMTLQSPLVLLNENGHPSPTVAALEKTLADSLGKKVKVKNAAAAFTQVEQFNAIWQAKSDKVPAFKEGSSFLMNLPENTSALAQLGEWTEQGFGRVVFERYQTEAKFELEKDTDSTDQSTQGQVDRDAKPSNAALVKIKEAFDAEKERLSVKTEAIKAANNKVKRINNHLIGRMERLFERSISAEEIHAWIKETQGKPAGDALRKADLVNHDHKFDLKIGQEKESKDNWHLQKLYWTTFFQTLRKKNKSDGK